MVKPTPDPPIVPLAPDYPLFHHPGCFERADGDIPAACRNAQRPASPKPCDLQRG